MNVKRDRYAWIVLIILLAAAVLRLHAITDVPPGLTHDEADHGVDAWGVVNGERPIYFTVGYGREPLYDYSTAVLMSFLGPTYLAGRLTSVYFSMILIAGMYAWVRRALAPNTALLTAAGLAVGFWPVMVSRHALRTVTMPALFVLAVLAFWHASSAHSKKADRRRYAGYLAGGLLLGATFYTYIPARLLWLVFPALLIYLALFDRAMFRRTWHGTLLMLSIAATIAAPLFYYLFTHPEAEVRVNQLAGPLTTALAGDWSQLVQNGLSGMAAITFVGDSQWRYNIAGQPFLPPVMGLLFYAGFILAFYHVFTAVFRRGNHRQQPTRRIDAALFVALIWFFLGLLPILITGPELGATQAVGMQPVLYLFPALALSGTLAWLQARSARRARRWAIPLVAALFILTGARTAWAYFTEWANEPEVRLQYESALVSAIRHLNETQPSIAVISSNTPDRFHDPAIAQMTLTDPDVSLRWFNGQFSLLLAQDGLSRLVLLGPGALHPALTALLPDASPATTLPLRESDREQPVTIYNLDGAAILATTAPHFQQIAVTSTADIQAADHLTFLGYQLSEQQAQAGSVIQLKTFWRIEQPPDTEAVLFTHIIGPDGAPIAQEDRLDVPSYYWHIGDVFIQLHEIVLPADVPPGNYPLAVGVYNQSDGTRWPFTVDGRFAGDFLPLNELIITE